MPDLIAPAVHLLHEVTSPFAFEMLSERGVGVACPNKTFGFLDHIVPTFGEPSEQAITLIDRMVENCSRHSIPLYDPSKGEGGIVHIAAHDLGLIQPGQIVVCGDSHTGTHGAIGALGIGIGSTQIAHVLATQSLFLEQPKVLNVNLTGNRVVDGKDLALAILAEHGTSFATGRVVEFSGPALDSLSIEDRFTLCNMSIEMGATSALIPPDRVTEEYLKTRGIPLPNIESVLEPHYEDTIEFCIDDISPMIAMPGSPDLGVKVEGVENCPLDIVFIGSCTNGRLKDIEIVASILQNETVPTTLRLIVVPGSIQVKQEAERKGLDRIILAAGGEWREPGCSFCVAMNGEVIGNGKLCLSTSNRNFIGRQGEGSRTILASPATAAASAIAGRVVERGYIERA